MYSLEKPMCLYSKQWFLPYVSRPSRVSVWYALGFGCAGSRMCLFYRLYRVLALIAA